MSSRLACNIPRELHAVGCRMARLPSTWQRMLLQALHKRMISKRSNVQVQLVEQYVIDSSVYELDSIHALMSRITYALLEACHLWRAANLEALSF